jgi:hypothetical protein
MQRIPIVNLCRIRPNASLHNLVPRRAFWTPVPTYNAASVLSRPTVPFSRPLVPVANRLFSLSLAEKTHPSTVKFARTWATRVRSTYFKDGQRGNNYSQRPPKRGLFSTIIASINRLPSVWIFYGIMGINATVFGLWWYAGESWVRHTCFSNLLSGVVLT